MYRLGKYQGFGCIFQRVATKPQMLCNSLRLRKQYTELGHLSNFVYFPLHGPGDMALTMRSPEYLDQLSLIEQILRAVPANCNVAIKEHPAMIGDRKSTRLNSSH